MSSRLMVHQVTKAYAQQVALKGVSFSLGSGFHALLGPNGAGKSTLFQLLTGLFTPDQGEIEIMGLNQRQYLAKSLRHIGVVFQQASLDLDLTVQANLTFYGLLHGMSKADIAKRSQYELDKIGLLDAMHKTCRELSGGNRRKVELARALLAEPNILLMDEATVGLDPASRDSLLQYVNSLCAQRGLCVLWATHLIDEAEQAQAVLVLHKGELLAFDTPAALVAQQGSANLLEAFLQMSGQRLVVDRARAI